MHRLLVPSLPRSCPPVLPSPWEILTWKCLIFVFLSISCCQRNCVTHIHLLVRLLLREAVGMLEVCVETCFTRLKMISPHLCVPVCLRCVQKHESVSLFDTRVICSALKISNNLKISMQPYMQCSPRSRQAQWSECSTRILIILYAFI